jgi:hypothetical protein
MTVKTSEVGSGGNYEEIELGNACYHSVQNLLSSRLLVKNVKIRIYNTIILAAILYGVKIGPRF